MDSGRLLGGGTGTQADPVFDSQPAAGDRAAFRSRRDALVPYLDGLCGLTVAVARIYGLQSPLFTLSLVMACIVMYDATGVRRAAGEHAKVLNQILFSDGESMTPSQKALKEFLGHTPLEVLAGAILGVILGLIMPV